MPKMIISIDGVVIKEVQLTKERTTLGRRPYNDIVIDNLAVSGEHAVLQMTGGAVFLEDLSSTNGTYVNGKAIKRQTLHHSDMVEVGKYKIKYLAETPTGSFDRTMTIPAGTDPAGRSAAPDRAPDEPGSEVEPTPALIRVLSGAAAGREVPLVKVVTTVGKPGVAVAAISRGTQGYAVSHVDGDTKPRLNGEPVSTDPVALSDGDVIDLAGTQMQFVQD